MVAGQAGKDCLPCSKSQIQKARKCLKVDLRPPHPRIWDAAVDGYESAHAVGRWTDGDCELEAVGYPIGGLDVGYLVDGIDRRVPQGIRLYRLRRRHHVAKG